MTKMIQFACWVGGAYGTYLVFGDFGLGIYLLILAFLAFFFS